MATKKLKANVRDIVYLPLPELPMPARREIIAIHIGKLWERYTLQNQRTLQTETYDDIDFGVKVFTDRAEAQKVLEGLRSVTAV